jgi:hypothetical protein
MLSAIRGVSVKSKARDGQNPWSSHERPAGAKLTRAFPRFDNPHVGCHPTLDIAEVDVRDMRNGTTLRRRKPPTTTRPKLDRDELGEFRQRLNDLPDLRLDKIIAIRQALSSGRYETDGLIDAVLQRMENDIGVLFRRNTT